MASSSVFITSETNECVETHRHVPAGDAEKDGLVGKLKCQMSVHE
jgi:hypothetical protein